MFVSVPSNNWNVFFPLENLNLNYFISFYFNITWNEYLLISFIYLFKEMDGTYILRHQEDDVLVTKPGLSPLV